MENTCNRKVGRLIEVRAAAGYRSAADVTAIFALIGKAFASLPASDQALMVVDWRSCPLMSSEATELLAARIIANNPKIIKSAALASRDAPVAMLQFLRLIRESKHPNRRLFNEPGELITWMSDVMTEAETRRLEAFLAEGKGLPKPNRTGTW